MHKNGKYHVGKPCDPCGEGEGPGKQGLTKKGCGSKFIIDTFPVIHSGRVVFIDPVVQFFLSEYRSEVAQVRQYSLWRCVM